MIIRIMISENFEKLFLEAKNVRENAHVPYSQFKVGAAFLTENNSIILVVMLKMPHTLNHNVQKLAL